MKKYLFSFNTKTKKTLFYLFLLAPFFSVFAQSPFIDNNTAAPNTFTVPAGVSSITIHLWGGGGAGGGKRQAP